METTDTSNRTYVTRAASKIKIPIRPDLAKDRYEMHRLQVEFRGNRVYFPNLKRVSKDLQIPPSYIPFYLSKIFKTRAVLDKNSDDPDAWILYPAPSNSDLQPFSDALLSLIQKFILCGGCSLPELNLVTDVSESTKATEPVPSKEIETKKKGKRESKKERRKNKKGSGSDEEKGKKVTAVCRACGWQKNVTDMTQVAESFREFVQEHPPKMNGNAKTQESFLGNGWTMPSAMSALPSIHDF